MKRFLWLGVLLAGAVLWSASLFISRYFAAPQPEVNLILSTLAVSGPAVILSLIADRLRQRKPLLCCILAYCLGSGAATGVVHSLQAPDGVPAGRSLEAALIHAATATLFVPGDEGGYVFVWANLLWLAMAGLVASIVLEALAAKFGGRPASHAASTPASAKPSPSVPRRSLRPRRKASGESGKDRHD